MKKYVIWLVKAFFAGCLALAMASAVAVFYHNPVPAVSEPGNATQTFYKPNTFGSTMREGICWGVTDANGYYNASVPEGDIQVLVMGSSHMQAVQVRHEERMPHLIQELTGKTTYNIGVSGYTLLECVKNLPVALDTMKPTEYLVIETASTTFDTAQIETYLSGQLPPDSKPYSGRLAKLVQKIPYARLAYSQLNEWTGALEPVRIVNPDIDEDAYHALLGYIADACIERGITPVIFYHREYMLSPEGSMISRYNPETLELFASVCENNGIAFVDMEDAFQQRYAAEYVLPNGYCNTAAGYGHMNRYGHETMAQVISGMILQMESERGEFNQ